MSDDDQSLKSRIEVLEMQLDQANKRYDDLEAKLFLLIGEALWFCVSTDQAKVKGSPVNKYVRGNSLSTLGLANHGMAEAFKKIYGDKKFAKMHHDGMDIVMNEIKNMDY